MNKFHTKKKILKNVNICVASAWYPYAGNPYHCIFVHEFAKRITRAGARAYVLSIAHTVKDKNIDKMDNIQILRVRPTHSFSFLRSSARSGKLSLAALYVLLLNLRDLLIVPQAFKASALIHVHAADLFGALSAILGRIMGKPVVITVHRGDVLPSHDLIYKLARSIALKVSNVIIAVSHSTRNLAIRCGAPPKRVIVVYNTVDESIFRPRSQTICRSKLGLSQKYEVILSVGNLIPRKGYDQLIRAFPKILNDVHDAVLIIVGDGPQKKELALLVSDLKLEDKVIFTGRIPIDKLCLYYSAADIFVLPSMHEGHAMVLLEGMASGLPVVASRVAGNLETVVHNQNGYLVQPNDINQLAEAVTKILSDERLIHSFGSQSFRMYKSKFSQEQQIHKIVQIYSGIIHRYEDL